MEAFEQILRKALRIYQADLFSYPQMPIHSHLILQRLIDGETSRFMGWVGGNHTMHYHASPGLAAGNTGTNDGTKAFRYKSPGIFWFVVGWNGTLCSGS